MRSSWRLLAILAISLGSGLPRPQPLHAQNNPITITGRVTNDAGAPLQLASVYIETLGLGAQTADDGRYQLVIPAVNVPLLVPAPQLRRSVGLGAAGGARVLAKEIHQVER